MNSLTFAFSEIRGRSYGGGVLELEPTEAEALPFPRQSGVLPLEELDLWARRKDPDQVLDEVDRLVLTSAGLGGDELRTLRDIWRKLSNRRLDRKRRQASPSPAASAAHELCAGRAAYRSADSATRR